MFDAFTELAGDVFGAFGEIAMIPVDMADAWFDDAWTSVSGGG